MSTVVFVCEHGAAKSVLAAVELERLAAARGVEVTARALGVEPDPAVAPGVIELRPDIADRLRSHRPERATRESLAEADRVVTIGLDPGRLPLRAAAFAAGLVSHWDDVPAVSDDPAGAREAVDRHLQALLDELTSRRGASNADPLISAEGLAARLDDPAVLVVDVRWVLGHPGEGRAAYDAGHIPGAIHLDLDGDLADLAGFGAPGRHPLPSPAEFAERLERVGIGDGTFIVAYDDVGGWVAARLWWMLDSLGHQGGEAVLDGGWAAWLAAGLPVSTDEPIPLPPAKLHLGRAWQHVIAREAVRARLGELVLLDARAAPRYRGETEPIDPVAGHIPTAVSAPWDGNLGPDGRMLPRDSLRDRFEQLAAGARATAQRDGNSSTSPEIVSYCGSGTSACHHALAMRIAGLPDPTIYVGSYSDWSRSGLPIATGAEPGPPPQPGDPDPMDHELDAPEPAA